MNIGGTVNWRVGGDSMYSDGQSLYRTRCNRTETHGINWEHDSWFGNCWYFTLCIICPAWLHMLGLLTLIQPRLHYVSFPLPALNTVYNWCISAGQHVLHIHWQVPVPRYYTLFMIQLANIVGVCHSYSGKYLYLYTKNNNPIETTSCGDDSSTMQINSMIHV